MRYCTLSFCGNGLYAKGLCKLHWRRKHYTGHTRKLKQPNSNFNYFYKNIKTETERCVEWGRPGVAKSGYASFMRHGKTWRVHRLALIYKVGEPKGRSALHKCGNKKCFNYRHLYWGTPKDNAYDRVRAGNGNKVLSAKEVLFIRRSKKSDGELSKILPVSYKHINAIRKGKYWSHVS